jgi:acyl dehydratase
MTAIHFETAEVGMHFRVEGRVVTEQDLLGFAQISGDRHPVHTDAAWAARSPFGQRIAHGPFGIALAIGLFARIEAFRETAIAMTDVSDWQFRAPIYIGDKLSLDMTIAARRTTRSGRGIIDRRLRLLKADGSIAQEGLSGMLIAHLPAEAKP